jgi:hypothetical protein
MFLKIQIFICKKLMSVTVIVSVVLPTFCEHKDNTCQRQMALHELTKERTLTTSLVIIGSRDFRFFIPIDIFTILN